MVAAYRVELLRADGKVLKCVASADDPTLLEQIASPPHCRLARWDPASGTYLPVGELPWPT